MNKTLLTTAIVLVAATLQGGQFVQVFTMPADMKLTAVDSKGVKHPNVLAVRDKVRLDSSWSPNKMFSGLPPGFTESGRRNPYIPALGGDWTGGGVYRLLLNPAGQVAQIEIVKQWGDKRINEVATNLFKTWAFAPGKWRSIELPAVVKKKWVQETATFNNF
jgi:hypothetical protein